MHLCLEVREAVTINKILSVPASERNRLTRGFPEFYNSPSIIDDTSTMSCESKNKNFYTINKTQILIVWKALTFCVVLVVNIIESLSWKLQDSTEMCSQNCAGKVNLKVCCEVHLGSTGY